MSFALRRPCLFAAACIFSLISTQVFADVVSRKSISYFAIGGRTATELDRELMRNGPLLKSTGHRHPGATRIRFGGDVTYMEKGGRCRVANARVTVTTEIKLPKWKYRAGANRQLAILWDTLLADIRRHEERHAEIARNHARQMDAAIRSLSSSDNCFEMQERVTEVSSREVESHDKDQARFDRIEAANFETRMIRLLKSRIARANP